MGSKGGGNQTQTQEPWSGQAPYLRDTFQQAQNLFQSGGPQYYPGATYTPFSSQTEQGLGLTEQRALNGSPVTGAAQNLAANAMNSQPSTFGAGNYIQQQLSGAPSLSDLSQFAGSRPGGKVFDPSQNVYDPLGGGSPDTSQTQIGGDVGGVGQGLQSYGTANQRAGVGQGVNYTQGNQQAGVGQGLQSYGTANQRAGVGQGLDYTQGNQQAGVGQGLQDYNAANQRAGVGQNQEFSFNDAQNTFQSQVSNVPDAANAALTQTAQGQNLTGNSYLDSQFDIAANKVTEKFNKDISPGLAAQFSLAGRTGSDAQADVQTRAAGEVSDSLGDLANKIYGGNYQAERDRQLQSANQLGALSQSQQGLGLQAAGQGADFYNQNQQQDLARRGLASDIYGTGQQQDIARRGLSGNLANQGSQQDLARRGLASDIYGTSQQQDISRRGLTSQSDLGRLGLDSASANRYLQARGQSLQAGATAGQQDINRLNLSGNIYGNQMSNQLGAANLGTNLYGQQMGQQNTMAGLSNSLANQDYTDINQLMGVGSRVEGLSNQALQDQMDRFNFYQNAPQNNLARYIASIQGNYGGTTTGQAPRPSRLQGAAGGAATGFSVGGPWGALAGGVLGALR